MRGERQRRKLAAIALALSDQQEGFDPDDAIVVGNAARLLAALDEIDADYVDPYEMDERDRQ